MKRTLALFILIVMTLSLTACGNKKTQGYEIPDIFGLDYTDAIGILEDEGFEVNAIETNVDSISEKLLYPLQKVDKGVVFKVDDYILDNNGNLTKNYDVFYKGEFVSDDKSLVIYYAKEDYVLKEEEAENNDTVKNQSSDIKDDDTKKNNELGSEFKAAMDSYEDFMDEYVSFMKKYKANPTDMSLLADYADYISRYADFVDDFGKWEDEEMNAAEAAYYLEVQTRVNKKLLEIA